MNITTAALIAATIVCLTASYYALNTIQQLQESVRLSSQRVTALERELRVSTGYPAVHYRALADLGSEKDLMGR
jgi:hypothetical protein